MLALIKAAKKGGSGIHISSTIFVLYCVSLDDDHENDKTPKNNCQPERTLSHFKSPSEFVCEGCGNCE